MAAVIFAWKIETTTPDKGTFYFIIKTINSGQKCVFFKNIALARDLAGAGNVCEGWAVVIEMENYFNCTLILKWFSNIFCARLCKKKNNNQPIVNLIEMIHANFFNPSGWRAYEPSLWTNNHKKHVFGVSNLFKHFDSSNKYLYLVFSFPTFSDFFLFLSVTEANKFIAVLIVTLGFPPGACRQVYGRALGGNASWCGGCLIDHGNPLGHGQLINLPDT